MLILGAIGNHVKFANSKCPFESYMPLHRP